MCLTTVPRLFLLVVLRVVLGISLNGLAPNSYSTEKSFLSLDGHSSQPYSTIDCGMEYHDPLTAAVDRSLVSARLSRNTYHLLDCTHLHFNRTASRTSCPAADEVLAKGSSLGLNVLRTWAFHDGVQKHKYPLQLSPGIYDENTFRMLDYTIARAKAHCVRLILPLVDFVGAYGGALQYLRWSQPRKVFKFEDRELFYNSSKARELFKKHVKEILTRRNVYTNTTYRDDPTILAWEILNEPRAPYDTSGDSLQAWLEEMSEYIRMLDRKHLISIGSEGWFGRSTPELMHLNPPTTTKYPIDWNATEGSDFVRNHNILAVDIATFRLWNHWLPDSESEDTQKKFWKRWIKAHLKAGSTLLNRPVILEEFGLRHVPVRTRDSFYKTVYKSIEKNMRLEGAAAGSCFWALSDDGYPDYDGFSVYLPAHKSTGDVVLRHVQQVTSIHTHQMSLRLNDEDTINPWEGAQASTFLVYFPVVVYLMICVLLLPLVLGSMALVKLHVIHEGLKKFREL